MRPQRVACVLVGVVAITAAAALQAQSPTPAPTKAKPHASGWASPAEGTSRYGGEVLEISQEVLDRFAKALAAEEAARQAIAAKQAQVKPAQEYAECKNGVMMSPEGMKLLESYNAAVTAKPDDLATMQKAATQMTMKMGALTEKACGPDPSVANRSVGDQLREAEATGAKDVGFTPRQFAILKERVVPMCLSDPAAVDAGGLKLPGQGNASFVYTKDEVEALRPRCEEFLKLLKPKQP
ncbi:MAG: hypothetical protein ACHQQS_03300 [Thermoanaerobaculales bacterium]